jgi:hypothetical protein
MENPRKNVGTAARSSISKCTARKRRRRIRSKKNDINDECEIYSQEDGGDSFVSVLATCAG